MGGRGNSSGRAGGGYKTFADQSAGTREYYGSGQEQVDFFKQNSNADVLIGAMSSEDVDAFQFWSRGGFMWGQQYEGWDDMDDMDKEMTQRFDDVLDNATLSKGIVVTRLSDTQLVLGAGNSRGTLAELQAAAGTIVKSKGSMSFAAASQGLSIGADVGIGEEKNIEYKLKIGPGVGAGMWIGDRRINGWGPKQREFMTNRDIAIRVGKTTYDSSRDIHVTELEFVGREAHDYGTTGRVTY